jgi:hypothetical protein
MGGSDSMAMGGSDSMAMGGAGGSGMMDDGPTAPSFSATDDPTHGTGMTDTGAYRFQVECKLRPGDELDLSGQEPSSYNFGCDNDICNVLPGGARTEITHGFTIEGDADVIYDLTIRVRGVMEPKPYEMSTCIEQWPRRASRLFPNEAGDITVCKGDTPENIDTFDTFRLTVPAHEGVPEQKFYMNAEQEGQGHIVVTTDGIIHFQARGGTEVETFWDDRNGGLIRNCVGFYLEEIESQPFNGNYYQLDIVEWAVVE